MNPRTTSLLAVAVLLAARIAPCMAAPAFAGAEGFGAQTRHARGTEVCRVDKLDDDKRSRKLRDMRKGTFRYCLARAREFRGAYVLFDVSGTIRLLAPAHVPSNVYIAGQTSPGGIAFEGHPIVVRKAEDVVIRHVRHREAVAKGDAFRILESRNVVLDHVSVSFFKDEAVDIGKRSSDVTVQWSHLGDAIESGAPKERYHGQPVLLTGNVDRISIHHNLFTHGHTRMPLVQHTVRKPGFLIEFTNNVIYNYGIYPSRFAALDGRGNVIGNLYIPGYNTHSDAAPGGADTRRRDDRDSGKPVRLKRPVLVENRMRLYLRDNLMLDGWGHDASTYTDRFGKQTVVGERGAVTGVRTDASTPDVAVVESGRGKIVRETVTFEPLKAPVAGIPAITATPARENLEQVLRFFGALPRDATDARLVAEVITRTGAWKYEKPPDFNAYPGYAPPDADGDGMPDAFEQRAGRDLEPTGQDLRAGVDNLEVYLDERAERLRAARAAVVPER